MVGKNPSKNKGKRNGIFIALELIEKYTDDPRCVANQKLLPVRANTVYNRDLKKVAKAVGIRKHFTTNKAYHTLQPLLLWRMMYP